MFWEKGWAALRVAGSGSMQYPSPDLLVGNKLRVLAIECKVTKETSKYFERKEISELKAFAEYFGAESWVAIKFQREGWLFMSIEDLVETEKSFVATLEKARLKGLTFEQVTGEF